MVRGLLICESLCIQIFIKNDRDSNVYMVETQSGTAISKLAAHEDTVSAICLLGDHQLVTTSWDSSIKVSRGKLNIIEH